MSVFLHMYEDFLTSEHFAKKVIHAYRFCAHVLTRIFMVLLRPTKKSLANLWRMPLEMKFLDITSVFS